LEQRIRKDYSNSTRPVKATLELFERSLRLEAANKTAPEFLDRRRLAVLPLASISIDPNDEYFADGLTEEMITELSKIHGLRVIARTSVNLYKNTMKQVGQIATELGVGTILEGSIRKDGNKVRVTIQLINATNEEHEWSQVYDKNLDDIFSIQSDIAKHVAGNLKLRFLEREEGPSQGKKPQNVEPYLSYLRGRSLLHKRDEASLRAAMNCFESALSLDKGFARAYSGLADALKLLGTYSFEPFKEASERAKAFAEKALEIDPSIAEAHASLGNILRDENQFVSAEKELKRAIKLNPSYAPAYHWYGNLLMFGFQKLEEAYQQLRLAEESDPLSVVVLHASFNCLLLLGRIDEAREKLEKLRQLEPEGFLYLTDLFSSYLYLDSDYSKAWAQLEKLEKVAGEIQILNLFEDYYAYTGQREKLEELIPKLESLPDNLYWPNQILAHANAALGKMERCFFYARKALKHSPELISVWMLWSRIDPAARAIVNNPRWNELIMEKE
jgi:adenylate cyclase